MATAIDGILFDLGDTLLEFGPVDIAGLFEAGARLTYDYLRQLRQPLPAFASYHRRQLWAIRWNYFKSRFTRREFNALELIGRLALRMGHELTPAQMKELAWLWYQPLSLHAKIEPGTRGLLEEFRSQRLTLGIVSNTFVPGDVLDRHLEEAGLLELLPLRVYSCDVGFRKPAAAIFQLALERAHLEPGRTLFVGDSPRADIDGAERAGMIPVLKDPANRHALAKIRPAHRVSSLLELREIVARYNAT